MFAGGDTVAEHVERLEQSRFAAYGTHLVVGPMYHTGPLSGARTLAAGVPAVVLGRFDAEATLAAIERFRIESSVMVPTHFIRFLALPEAVRGRYDVSSVRLVSHTGARCPVPGARCPVEVKQAMIDWWGPVSRKPTGPPRWARPMPSPRRSGSPTPGSVGQTVPPFEAMILDDRGNRSSPACTFGTPPAGKSSITTIRSAPPPPTWSPACQPGGDRLYGRGRVRLDHRPLL
jgi:long-chain acyl-CoA synthetase